MVIEVVTLSSGMPSNSASISASVSMCTPTRPAPPANIDLMVRLLSLPFDAVVSGEEVARGKPAPDIFLRAAECLDLPPARVVVTEDAPAGVEAGKAAGSRVIALAATFPAESLAAADLVVRSFAEVLWPAEQWERFVGA